MGAGATRLICSEVSLGHGLKPLIFEASRSFGGRLATRRRYGVQFDHGAQAMRSAADYDLLADIEAAGGFVRWPESADPAGEVSWVGVPRRVPR